MLTLKTSGVERKTFILNASAFNRRVPLQVPLHGGSTREVARRSKVQLLETLSELNILLYMRHFLEWSDPFKAWKGRGLPSNMKLHTTK